MLIEDEALNLAPRFPDATARPLPLTDDPVNTTMLIEDLIDRQIWSLQCGLDHAARELGMSPATLKRRLAEMNTSYSEILRKRRMHHATRLLKESDMNVADIALALGYSAVSNFSRAYRNATGFSPNSFRSATSL